MSQIKSISSVFLATLLVFLIAFSGSAEARRSHHSQNPTPQSSTQRSNPGKFDYYLLALSWSPEFCASPAGQKSGKNEQCAAKLGFVVHGLWPENNDGSYPQDCGAVENVPATVAEIAQTGSLAMPRGDSDFVNHEWNKHGTCSGLDMAQYFTAIKDAADKIKIPEPLRTPEAPVTMDGEAIVSAFASANAGLSADMINTQVDKKGDVSGVIICFTKALTYQSCTDKHSHPGGIFLPVGKGK